MPAKKAEQVGCVVTGQILTRDNRPADGATVRFEPAGVAMHGGRIYSADAFTVKAGPDGRFSVTLVAGTYTAHVAGQKYRLRVPDQPAARFTDLIGGQ